MSLSSSLSFRNFLIDLPPGRINKLPFRLFCFSTCLHSGRLHFLRIFCAFFARNTTRFCRFNQFNCCFSRRSPTPVATVLNHGPSFCILRVSVGLCHSRSWFFVVRSGSLFRSVGHRACGPRRLIPAISFNLKPPRLEAKRSADVRSAEGACGASLSCASGAAKRNCASQGQTCPAEQSRELPPRVGTSS